MLHTVNKSPFEKNSLLTCLRLARPGSDILLIEDGVYAAVSGTTVADKLRQAMQDKVIYVLSPDLRARGIAPEKLIGGVKTVDYNGFVKLAATNDRVQSWL